ncbi:MAG TPA: hypothetical protein PKH02_07485 [Bacteroidales bacterium]|nr:hypothetical protein [Bacteroidales bacterium]HPT11102.1 hypothetical protein [Bacteroidales bacterium]
MRCLSRVEIQKYIDNEVDPTVYGEMSEHIRNCSGCSALHKEAIRDKELITGFLSLAEEQVKNEAIPAFKIPAEKRFAVSYKWTLSLLAAASLAGLVIFIRIDRKPHESAIPEAEIIKMEYLDGNDLNKLWHDKSQILIIEDEKGNVIQTTVTY